MAGRKNISRLAESVIQHKAGGPFDLRDSAAYEGWRARKLERYPGGAADLVVDIEKLGAVTAAERAAILTCCRRANMAIYRCRDSDVSAAAIRQFGAAFGLRRLDRHLCARESGISEIAVAARGRRRHYVPYSDKSLSWHTDGYYNDSEQRICAIVLHCVRTAATGGENGLLDHEIAYIRLRDENPDFIAALMHPQCLTIPANEDESGEIRPARSGPVFSTGRATGALHMRFTMRKRHVAWRDDATTREALGFMASLLSDASGPAFHYRLAPGQGIIGNNVLHDRTAFEDDPAGGRLYFRARYLDRIAGTSPAG